MQEALKVIINIQDFDMKMMRLMRLKKERQKELEQIDSLRKELYQQYQEKEKEIVELDKTVQTQDVKIQEIIAKIKRIELQQSNIKKADEFTSLTQEMTSAEREKTVLEQKVSDLVDKKHAEEELLERIKTSLQNSEESSLAIEKEIQGSIDLINAEGSSIKHKREELAKQASPDILALYERLLKNKKDRVIVPIENRTCSGCHIVLTAQHENLVRKGENMVFCEHCSRIHYWQEAAIEADDASSTKRRRRRLANT
ncbi:MAG: C4-type zinc ribbon domain-containing protein [Chlamydiae bacterium]|nr:C4-type zinc ribbon domain-containing protein [Chlamydiota bacterium]